MADGFVREIAMSILLRARSGRAHSSQPLLQGAAAFAAAWILFSGIAGVARAQSNLSLADSLRIAVERSKKVAAQDASITAIKEMGVAAGQLPDPVLKFGLDN